MAFWFIISNSFNFSWVFKHFLINLVIILMISVKMANLGFLKITVKVEIKVMTSQFLPMTSPAKFCHAIQIILYMCSCDQSLVTLAFLWKKLSQPQLYKDLTRRTAFFEEWSWFKFDNLGLALGINLKFYTSVAKGLKLKVRKCWGLIPTFAEDTGKKLVGEPFSSPSSWIGLIQYLCLQKFFSVKASRI